MMTLQELLAKDCANWERHGDTWWPSRSLPYSRLRDAWEVLRGRAEAVRWPNQEGGGR